MKQQLQKLIYSILEPKLLETITYSALEVVHDNYASVVGNDAISLRQKLERELQKQLKQKVSNWDEVWSDL
jgi:hypothetical protein